jgi:hypothetical protein
MSDAIACTTEQNLLGEGVRHDSSKHERDAVMVGIGLRIRLLGLAVLLTACGGGGTQSPAGGAGTSADGPPAAVGEAFCQFLDERARLLEGEVGVAFHGAQAGELDEAVAVSTEIVLPALVAMSEQLEAIETWEPGRAWAGHTDPLVREFADSATAFVDDPSQDTFNRVDIAGQVLRNDAFADEFARVGIDVFKADCG